MSIKSRNKVDTNFSMSSMTDIVFLLLIFFVIMSTMVNPNAIKLLLPKSAGAVKAEAPVLTVSIDENKQYFVGTKKDLIPVAFEQLESELKSRLKNEEIPTIKLHADKSVEWDNIVMVMDIAKRNKYKLIAATSAN